MANIIEVTDLTQQGPNLYIGLTDSELRRRIESQNGIFIAESPNVIERAFNSGCTPISFLMERKHIEGDAKKILSRFPDIPIYTAESKVLEQIVGFKLTRGVLCAMNRPTLPTVKSICANASRIVILENITESTNVGEIFRSAAALNIDAVLVTPECCDPLNRRSVRVSMGTVFQVPWTRIGSRASEWPLPGIETIKSLGFKTIAMALSDNSISIEDKALSQEKKLAIILGTEGDGLSSSTIANCDYIVRIPMSHQVDSLNVGAAGAVAFWELRKR